MSHYVVIPRLEVKNANAQPAWWMIGPPPITAYMGFAHALERHLGVRHNGIAIIHHDAQFPGEFVSGTFRPAQFKAASFINEEDYNSHNPGSPILSSQPTARCHLDCSLVLRFDEGLSLDSASIAPWLRGRRLAGGDILRHGDPVLLPYESDPEKVIRALKQTRRLLWSILDRKDLMVKGENDKDPLDTLLRVTRRFKHDSGKKSVSEESQKFSSPEPWLMPTTVGYAEISERKNRRQVRGNLPHAYAEPLVGLVQYKTLGRDTGLHFWRWSRPMPGVYLALAHP